ncbi:hypothetical protein V8D89_012695 [Ganoderma adspersum]
MPVTFKVASHPANTVYFQNGRISTTDTVFEYGCEAQAQRCKEMLQSSVQNNDLATIVPTNNGFVHTVLEAHGSHHHLRIRPDDVWLAILVQLNFYINAHAEELRSLFVTHEGEKRLVVRVIGDRYTVDYGSIAQTFTKRIHDNVVDATFVEWILPDFTTTTTKDTTVCSVVMMATLKEYFEYYISIECGIPSEPAVWAEMLRPIIRRFITAFDGKPDATFWTHVAYHCNDTCGQGDLSGWITAFCVWSNKGVWKGGSLPESIPVKPEYAPVSPHALKSPGRSNTKRLDKIIPKCLRRHSKSPMLKSQSPIDAVAVENDKGTSEPSRGSVMVEGRGSPTYTLDGIPFFMVPLADVPPRYCEVDVIVNDNGDELDCMMVAGHVAFSGSAVGNKTIDTISPSAQWFMFEKT